MLLNRVRDILACEIISGCEMLDAEVKFGCASDLMSDVLAFSQADALLLTGLVNIQTIHTAFIAEIKAIVFVRGKKPDNRVISLAQEKNIPLMSTGYSMYEACGLLYNNGLTSTMECLSKSKETAKSS